MQRVVCGKLFGCNGLRREGQIFSEFSANFTQKTEKPVVGNPSDQGNLGPGGRRSGGVSYLHCNNLGIATVPTGGQRSQAMALRAYWVAYSG